MEHRKSPKYLITGWVIMDWIHPTTGTNGWFL